MTLYTLAYTLDASITEINKEISEHSGKKDLKATCLMVLDRRKVAVFYVESSHQEQLNISSAELRLTLHFFFVSFYTWDSFTIVPEQSCIETRRLLLFLFGNSEYKGLKLSNVFEIPVDLKLFKL